MHSTNERSMAARNPEKESQIDVKTQDAKATRSENESDILVVNMIQVPGYSDTLEYTIDEERRARLKVDLAILPFIVLLFCFLQFDRTQIGFALTDGLKKDIHVGNNDINLAQTLFVVGFIITELPFNMISKVVGPDRFLPVTMILWGIATWSQAFLKGPSSLFVARFFIGALEGGYIPGFTFYMARFYINQELALRYAIFWASNSIAGALGGPLAIGLTSLGGRHGLKGWQWLFLIEGVLTCFLGVVAFIYLPHGPTRPKSFFGRSWNIFTDKEASIIVTRVIRNDPTKAFRQGKAVLPSHVLDTFKDWRLYGHIISAFLSMLMIQPMNNYAPSIIKSLGFSGLQADGLNSVGSVCALIFSVSLAFSSDKFRERGFHVALGFLWGAAGLLWLALAPTRVGKWVLYGGVVMTQMGMGSAQAINAAWLATKMSDYKRPVALAAYVMSIQLAGLPGNQLFRSQDAPRYRHGLIIAASCAISGAVVILAQKLLYRLFDNGDAGIETKFEGRAESRANIAEV